MNEYYKIQYLNITDLFPAVWLEIHGVTFKGVEDVTKALNDRRSNNDNKGLAFRAIKVRHEETAMSL